MTPDDERELFIDMCVFGKTVIHTDEHGDRRRVPPEEWVDVDTVFMGERSHD